MSRTEIAGLLERARANDPATWARWDAARVHWKLNGYKDSDKDYMADSLAGTREARRASLALAQLRAPSPPEATMTSDRIVEALARALEGLREASANASEGPAYVCGPPWFKCADGVLIGSPDRHVGRLIADTDTSMYDDDHDGTDDEPNAVFIAAAWNFARLIVSAPTVTNTFLAALRADPAPVAPVRGDGGWQDIGTAPKDKTEIQGYMPWGVRTVWRIGTDWVWYESPSLAAWCQPTHWRPLPPVPDSQQTEGQDNG